MARKKHATYDSKETFTVIGLLSIIASIIFLVSIVIPAESSSNIFYLAKSLFGTSTIVTVIFLFSFGLNRLGSQLSFTRFTSLLAQFLLMFIIPALFTSFATAPRELARGEVGMGGEVGYFIVQNLLGETIPTQPATKFILIALFLVFFPLAISLSLSGIIDNISYAILWVVKLFSTLRKSDDDAAASIRGGKDLKSIEKATTFGDFAKERPRKDSEKVFNETPVKRREDLIAPRVETKKVPSTDEIEFSEEKMNRENLTQEDKNYKHWSFPPTSVLIPFKKLTSKEPAIDQNAKIIEQTLASFDVEAKVEEYYIGPSVVQYALNIPLGVKVEKVSGLSANLALALGVDSKSVRIDTIPDTTYLGIEIPRTNREMVRFKELVESEEIAKGSGLVNLQVPIGKDIDGSIVVADIQKMPHLLIAGATGSGKSVLTNSFISALLMEKTPDELRLILVDPKQVEFSDYNGIAHLLTPVITNMGEVVDWLKYAVFVMENRYTILAKEQVRNIQGYNEKKGFPAMPYIVIVIDEMADMMLSGNKNEIELQIVRLAQKARAVGIHLILATQRPSVNVITGIIKANIPGRIGMSVTSSTDSRVILDRIGAESLMGRGDLLYKAPDKTKSSRLQGGNVEQAEISRIVDSIKSQAPEPAYLTLEDVRGYIGGGMVGDVSGGGDSFSSQGSLLEQAIRIAVQHQKGSSSFLQRKLNIGFNKAAQLVEELESLGVVGPQNGSKPREVLISDAEGFIQSLKANK